MEWTHVTIGHLVVLGGTAGYAASVLARGRRLTARIPVRRRRFLG